MGKGNDPAIEDLPSPPGGRTGWPWTEQSTPLSPQMPDGRPWPSITVVMPSLNQAEFLEEAIRSVLLQGYPNLEFVIRDGGSTDGSTEIIRRYEPWITRWRSKPDGGQCRAINDAFESTSGDVFHWLCSDDILYPDALATVAREFAEDATADVVCGWGKIEFLLEPSKTFVFRTDWERVRMMPFRNTVPQQSCFVRRRALTRQPLLDEDLNYYMDYDLWCHLLAEGRTWRIVPRVLGSFRMYGENKTGQGGAHKLDELETIYRRYRKEPVSLAWWYRRTLLPVEVWTLRKPSRFRTWTKRTARAAFIAVLGPWYGFRLTRALRWPPEFALPVSDSPR